MPGEKNQSSRKNKAAAKACSAGNSAADPDRLLPREEAFVRAYVADPARNGAAAARAAGYSAGNADMQAARLKSRERVARAIEEAEAELGRIVEDRYGVTVDKVLRELALMAFANMADIVRSTPDGDPFLDLSKMTRDQAAALTEATTEDFVVGRGENARDVRRVKVKLADKKSALELLGRYLGMWKEKGEGESTLSDAAFKAFLDMAKSVDRSSLPIAPNKPAPASRVQ